MTGPIGKAPNRSCMPCSIRRCCAFISSAVDACMTALAPSWLRTPSRPANRPANSAAISFDRTRPDAGLSADRAGEQAFGRGHRQQRGGDARTRALAEDGDIARVTAELGDVVPNPLQSQHQIAQEQVAVDGDVRSRQRRQVQTTQHAEPVVDRHVHATAARQRGAVVDRGRRAAHDVPAAVDEHHHRQRFFAGLFGGDDVEGEAVFAHGLVPADTDQGVATLLGRAVGEAVAVPHPRPGLHGSRRAEPQPPHRRLGVRDGSPAVYAVAREALDGAGGGVHADSALMHSPTVADTTVVGRAERRNPLRGS